MAKEKSDFQVCWSTVTSLIGKYQWVTVTSLQHKDQFAAQKTVIFCSCRQKPAPGHWIGLVSPEQRFILIRVLSPSFSWELLILLIGHNLKFKCVEITTLGVNWSTHHILWRVSLVSSYHFVTKTWISDIIWLWLYPKPTCKRISETYGLGQKYTVN